MSLRGVGKAIYRTPHHLFGHKSDEDKVYKQWEHDIEISIAGLEYLKSENGKLQKFWLQMTTNLNEVINIFLESHKQLGVSEETDKNEEFATLTMHEIEQAFKLSTMIHDKVKNLSKVAIESFDLRCNEMVKVLKNVQKLMTKRDHKKIDYDMQTKKLDSLLKNETTTDKEKSKLETNKTKLTEIEIVYKDINEKVNMIIPEVLSSLSEFLNKLTQKIYFSNMEILDYITRNLSKFNRVQGIVPDASYLSYETIIDDFNELHSQGQNTLNSLKLLKDFSALREKTLASKTTQTVNNAASTVVDSTINFTSTVYTKASKPGQKLSISLGSVKIDNPVKPFSKSGVFTTVIDPIEFEQNSGITSPVTSTSKLPPLPITTSQSSSEVNSDIVSHTALSPQSQTIPVSNNKDWLKPLKNSSIVTNKKSTPLTSPTTLDSDKVTLDSETVNTDIDDYYQTKSALNLDLTSETYKYVNISVNNITKQIHLMITTPEIKKAPLTTKDSLYIHDSSISKLIMAKSSITANAFRSLY